MKNWGNKFLFWALEIKPEAEDYKPTVDDVKTGIDMLKHNIEREKFLGTQASIEAAKVLERAVLRCDKFIIDNEQSDKQGS